EGIEVKYTDEAIEAIAEVAYLINQQSEDIGARRLHTVMEKLFEELSFNAPDLKGQQIVITEEYVKEQLKDSLNKYEVNKYIL
ncbi:MAG TPA: HslU--HslV peptidase ATPase subunit, partial [Thermoanaerobacter sp.]|nr:HslU--HslV peptidase ATPase subunit [Thermoanaerobacter sp.]